MAALQHVTLVPLILEAEKYESGAAAAHKHTQVTPRPTDIGAALANVLDGLSARDRTRASAWRPSHG